MARKLLIICVSAAFLFSCAKKKKVEEAPPTPAPTEDKSIQAQEMTYNPQGSDSGQIAGLSSINFGFDKSVLTPEARETLKKNAEWMKTNATANIQVEGHCDRWGSIEYNLGLGERRAKAVKEYLVTLGVAASRLSTIR